MKQSSYPFGGLETASGGVLYKKGVLKNFAIAQENTCATVSFS